MGHDGLTRSPSGLSERRTGFSPPELGSPTAPVVPPTGAVPYPDDVPAQVRSTPVRLVRTRRPQVVARGAVVHRSVVVVAPPGRGDEPVRMTSHQRVTAVVGASGGLGASTLALAVGRRLAATGPPSVVVDLDLLRGGLEVTAGVEHLPGRRWDDLRHARGRVPPEALLPLLPAEEGCAVLSARGGAPPGVPEVAARDVVAALAHGPARVVLDLPLASPVLPHVLAGGALVVLLVGLRTRALADADAAVSRLLDGPEAPEVPPDLRLVTRGGRAGTDAVDHGVAHLHHLADDPHVSRDAERGLFPGTGRDGIRRCADAVVAAVAAVAVAS